jgi:DNA-binding transcriptional LysR family regulator
MVNSVLDEIAGLRERPAGRVRVVMPRLAAKMVLAPKLEAFARQYPDVVLEVTSDDSRLDLVAGRYDAGIHLGEFIERDMVAVRVSLDQRAAMVAAPPTLRIASQTEPSQNLIRHRCINISMGSSGIYRWEFDKDAQSLVVGVSGPLTIDMDVSILAALAGIGLAYSF